MPVLTSPDMANKFQEKWLEIYPEDDHQHHHHHHPHHHQVTGSDSPVVPPDDSLTSLHWLQNFSILNADSPERPNKIGPGCALTSSSSSSPHTQQHDQHHQLYLRRLGFPRGTGTDSPSSPPAGDTAATGMPLYLGSPVTSGSDPSGGFVGCTHPNVFPHHQLPIVQAPAPPAEVDYKSNPKIKPPYSYASLICMAMQASKQPKVTLSTIYNWITDNFCYYRHAEPSWQNSIRHNLSLNKCFKKVPRQKDEPGKGGFWQIDPQYADMFVNGIFKRRRMSANHYSSSGTSASNSAANADRQNKLLQGYHHHYSSQNGCPYSYQGACDGKRKPPTSKNNNKGSLSSSSSSSKTTSDSPLLGMHRADILRGDFNLASIFDDVLGGSCSATFEDLDINTALSALGCEMQVASAQGRQQGRWCGNEFASQNPHPGNHYQSSGYLEMGATSMDCTVNLGEINVLQQHQQQHLDQDQLLQSHHQHQHHHHLQPYDETAALFPEQPEEVTFLLQPLDEIKEEAQSIPLGLDQGLHGLCEGFFAEMQPWERVEAYL